jgi:hypothetical protein
MGKSITRRCATTGILVCAFLFVVVIGWTVVYPSENDPKNIKYVLSKNGLSGINLDTATGTMIGDANSEKLVVGKTKAQLRKKFGYLLTPSEASPYLKSCFQGSARKSGDVLFIRNSSWMVVFENDKATELVLIKGC